MPEIPMKTRAQRIQHFTQIIRDGKVEMSFKEFLVYTYHLMAYERAQLKAQHDNALIKKHAIWLNNQDKVFHLRKDLFDL